jgi:transmembrane 9 superfamily protein 2/4
VRRDLLAYDLAAAAGLESGSVDASDASASVTSPRPSAGDEGWKLVRGDVFRPPPHAEWLAVGAGSGAQVLCVVGATATLGALGFMSPSARGSLLTAAVLSYLLSAGAAGAAAVRTLAWAHAGGGGAASPPGAAAVAAVSSGWRRVCLRTAACLPSAAAAALAAVNVVARAAGDAGGAVPASLFISLFFLVRSHKHTFHR